MLPMMNRGLLLLGFILALAGQTWCWEHATTEALETSLGTPDDVVLVACEQSAEVRSTWVCEIANEYWVGMQLSLYAYNPSANGPSP